MTLADKVIAFNQSLSIEAKLPKGVVVLNPFQQQSSLALAKLFYQKFYNDNASRKLIIGINPGRLGGGLTGIPFTDPIRLKTHCDIDSTLPQKPELSSDFIYRMIELFGGVNLFYSKFYFTSVSPLGFMMNEKNLNYYDIRELQDALMPFIVRSLQAQLNWGLNRDEAFCLGDGDNYKFLSTLNQKHAFFKKITPLPHPRFIMQYKRKQLTAYLHSYCEKLKR